ncbi:hypothetical protein HJC23_013137 [Cyclotella cryptica]|uniref:HSF-type DNA-binding domain-containing protein n=1 Tax=Cyclotella cryptica TaxID=29204 RepID=A0ABD3QN69_9STRA|eukprot:CCRYP_003948-RB/>CCRYP_003948-RB protein AED:0.04 eAED:0.04 QI:98/1/1/1/0.66/0.5/4/1980/465
MSCSTLMAVSVSKEGVMASTNTATKRERDDLYDAGSDDDFTPSSPEGTKKKAKKIKPSVCAQNNLDATAKVFAAELRPPPYFYYRDHSTEVDDDPLTPVTASGHVPCFPAKMHAILASPDLNDIVAWDDHGRSFRILKPKRFECYILPRFFEHSKFSSFIRQANGWGFRRFLSGPNRNSYYQEYFLRSMPWLCKKMRRPKVGEKKGISPEHEPDLRLISKEFPVPNNPMTREIQIVLETIKQGPRARMPVHWATEQLPPTSQQGGHSKVETSNPRVPAQANLFGASGVGAIGSNAFQLQAAMAIPPVPIAAAVRSRSGSASNEDSSATNHTCSLQQKDSTDDGFTAGFQAATQYHNDSVRSILANTFVRGGPVPFLPGSIGGIPVVPASGIHAGAIPFGRADAAYMHLLQMQMAAQCSFGGGGGMGANTLARHGWIGAPHNFSSEQFQGQQGGSQGPSMPSQSGG